MIERINPGKRASQMVLVDGRIETAGIVALQQATSLRKPAAC